MPRTVTPLSSWLRTQMRARGLSQAALITRAGINTGTLDRILTAGDIPDVETLFRLADVLDTPRVDILLITGHLRRGDQLPGARSEPPDHDAEANMEWQLIEEFRRIPSDERPDGRAVFQTIVHLSKRPRYHLIGDAPG